MNREEIMEAIRTLALPQGSYGRLYQGLTDMMQFEPDKYDEVMNELEAQKFGSAVDLVLFFEC